MTKSFIDSFNKIKSFFRVLENQIKYKFYLCKLWTICPQLLIFIKFGILTTSIFNPQIQSPNRSPFPTAPYYTCECVNTCDVYGCENALKRDLLYSGISQILTDKMTF